MNNPVRTPVGPRVSSDIRGRSHREPNWPNGGMVTRPVDDHRYEVQAFTGRPVSNNPKGRWNRGTLIRGYTMTLRPSGQELYMYDPSDPVVYVNTISEQRKRGLLHGRGRR